jgi:hypothetical protein
MLLAKKGGRKRPASIRKSRGSSLGDKKELPAVRRLNVCGSGAGGSSGNAAVAQANLTRGERSPPIRVLNSHRVAGGPVDRGDFRPLGPVR